MSLTNPEDAASLLEQFVHDVANTPAEMTHLLEEMQAKDLQIAAYKDEIHKRDAQLQKWVRMNGGHVLNPKEEPFSKTINDCYDKCEILQAEKCGLSEKALIVLERQIKRLDVGLRGLSAREEFPADWNGPSMLSASEHPTGVNTPITGGGGAVHHGGPLQALSGNVPGGAPNIANAAQMRMAAQAAGGLGGRSTSGGGTTTPSNMSRGQREGSADSKRRRLNASGTTPAASSNLRQSSLGPGTPKAGTPAPTASGTSRAGSQQPARPAGGQKKGAAIPPTRKAQPPPQVPSGRKRDRNRATKKGDRRRQLKSDRATPSTNASLSEEEDSASPTPSSLPQSQTDGISDRRQENRKGHHRQDQRRGRGGGGGGEPSSTLPSEDEEEDEDDMDDDNGPYCVCQRGSFGEMVCCDNDNCEFQWFHFGCVGMKEQPLGEWFCPDCRKLPRAKIVKAGE